MSKQLSIFILAAFIALSVACSDSGVTDSVDAPEPAPVCGDGLISASEGCDDGNVEDGDGCTSGCVREFCGDGAVNNAGAEQCDDGNPTDGDGCTAACALEHCGDGAINNAGAEQCDDGGANSDAPDTCRLDCRSPRCGDGIQDSAETCDDGGTEDGDGCSGTCALEFCGDGVVNNLGREACDDGNAEDNDGCSSSCVVEICGDARVNTPDEVCDDGPFNSDEAPDACRTSCLRASCGDDVLDSGEGCDDGNTEDDDGCSGACVPEFCGDGVTNGVETCDDGNLVDGDGCTAACVLERCGDGVVNNAGAEQCDDGDANSDEAPDACRTSCRRPRCGDGALDSGEACDDDNNLSGDGCSRACFDERCGDGVVQPALGEDCEGGRGCSPGCVFLCGNTRIDPGEQCDDGGREAGDGCSAICQDEICGNGILDPDEECDDADADEGDGCSNDCLLESCGDGALDGGEACDDGDTEGGDGCSALCRREVCGDGIINEGEQCDDGGRIPGDGCSARCRLEVCGNGQRDIGEACDDGGTQSGDGCSETCLIEGCEPGNDADSDGLEDCFETGTGRFRGPLDTGSDPNNPDTDGDGLLDGDEVLGTSAGLNLPALGASPVHMDLFIEVDWFEDSTGCGPHSHRPTPEAVAIVEAMFARAPLANPDGVFGIALRLDYGQGRGFSGGELIPVEDDNITGRVDGEFLDYKRQYHAPERHGAFHYVLAVHRYDNTSSSGWAEIRGDDFIVASQCWSNNSAWVAGTLAHELGHNIGLHHGGNTACNHKPNYNSVMNYRYQFNGRDDSCDGIGDGVVDYSHGLNNPLDENNLDERAGICGGVAIDWNRDGEITDGVVFDLNRSDAGSCGGALSVLPDHGDWGLIRLGQGIGDGDGAQAPTGDVIECAPAPSEGSP